MVLPPLCSGLGSPKPPAHPPHPAEASTPSLDPELSGLLPALLPAAERRRVGERSGAGGWERRGGRCASRRREAEPHGAPPPRPAPPARPPPRQDPPRLPLSPRPRGATPKKRERLTHGSAAGEAGDTSGFRGAGEVNCTEVQVVFSPIRSGRLKEGERGGGGGGGRASRSRSLSHTHTHTHSHRHTHTHTHTRTHTHAHRRARPPAPALSQQEEPGRNAPGQHQAQLSTASLLISSVCLTSMLLLSETRLLYLYHTPVWLVRKLLNLQTETIRSLS
ncbi:SKI family transcriptional corepressor 2-like [Coturnix japonica]|uniref:SKI family transcriptional corepressor 2-like n=1 Tax=Coturnix japonica TaxID=93934 RepID=UPI0013A5E5D5|nr:SKI family transcriptional corepressor 2-like [Coturnix japonica]